MNASFPGFFSTRDDSVSFNVIYLPARKREFTRNHVSLLYGQVIGSSSSFEVRIVQLHAKHELLQAF